MKIQSNIKCEKCNKCAFVARKSAKENRKGIFDILNDTNKLMKEKKYPGGMSWLVGSSKRNMIYIRSEDDIEYDHDIQYVFQNKNNPISDHTEKLRDDFLECLKASFPQDGHKWKTENSTRVITIIKSLNGEFVSSFDIALIDSIKNTIHVYDKNTNLYIWNPLDDINEAYKDAKNIDLILLKEEYIKLKHNQKNMSKEDENYKSSSKLFIESVNNVKARTR